MLKFGNTEFRNLEEQVCKNKSDIEYILEQEGVLNQFGIKVVGQQVNLPTVEEYKEDNPDWEYGDAFAIGSTSPYNLHILTRANGTHPDDYWFNIGQFPAPSTVPGPAGEAATIAVGTVTTGNTTSVTNVGTEQDAVFNFVLEKGPKGDTSTITIGTVTSGDTPSVTNVGTSTDAVFNFVLKQGEPGAPSTIPGPPGPKGDKGDVLTIISELASEELLPDPDTTPRSHAYLIKDAEDELNHIWMILEDTEDSSLYWHDGGAFQGARGQTGATGQTGLTALSYPKAFTYSSSTTISQITLNKSDFNRTPVVGESILLFMHNTSDHKSYMGTYVVYAVNTSTVVLNASGSLTEIFGEKGEPALGYNSYFAFSSTPQVGDSLTLGGNGSTAWSRTPHVGDIIILLCKPAYTYTTDQNTYIAVGKLTQTDIYRCYFQVTQISNIKGQAGQNGSDGSDGQDGKSANYFLPDVFGTDLSEYYDSTYQAYKFYVAQPGQTDTQVAYYDLNMSLMNVYNNYLEIYMPDATKSLGNILYCNKIANYYIKGQQGTPGSPGIVTSLELNGGTTNMVTYDASVGANIVGDGIVNGTTTIDTEFNIPIIPGTGINIDANEDGDALIISATDGGDYLPLAGGTMAGDINMDYTNKITFNDVVDEPNTEMYIKGGDIATGALTLKSNTQHGITLDVKPASDTSTSTKKVYINSLGVYPSNDDMILGSPAYPWDQVAANSITFGNVSSAIISALDSTHLSLLVGDTASDYATVNLAKGTTLVAPYLYPTTSDSRGVDLGASTYRFNGVYSNNINTAGGNVTISDGGVGGAIEIGNKDQSSANKTPFIDWHTGLNNDFDVRLIASGGTASSTGLGDLKVVAKSLTPEWNNSLTNHYATLGTSSQKWDTLYATKLSDGTTTKTMTEVLAGGGGGSSYTFTNGLTENSGTVSWDLNNSVLVGGSDAAGKYGATVIGKDITASKISFNATGLGWGIDKLAQSSIAIGYSAATYNENEIFLGASKPYSTKHAYFFGLGNRSMHSIGSGEKGVPFCIDKSKFNCYTVGDLYVNCTDTRTDNSTGNFQVTNCGGKKVVTEDQVPAAPTADGNYVLKCSISSGTATYTWVAE